MSEELPTIWHPTMKLRRIKREAGPGTVEVLQQAWRNVSSNELEYRDVELVEEAND